MPVLPESYQNHKNNSVMNQLTDVGREVGDVFWGGGEPVRGGIGILYEPIV
jgi:hypothetical protein